MAVESLGEVYSLTKNTKLASNFGLKEPIWAKSANESKPGTVNIEPVNAYNICLVSK